MTNTRTWGKRGLELVALLMVGEGALACVRPRDHIGLWRRGPEPWQRTMDKLIDRPGLTRALAVVEIFAGAWLFQIATEGEDR